MRKMLDFLIIGGGVAGRNLQLQAQELGYSTLVIDQEKTNYSSQVAAGIVNPVTGKYYALSWRADEIFPELKAYYQQWENKLGASFFKPKKIVRVFSSAGEQNTWLSKASNPKYQPYCSFSSRNIDGLNGSFGVLEVHHGGHLNLQQFMAVCHQQLPTRNEEFSFQDLDLKRKSYQDISFKYLVFCEGFKLSENPFFNYLPLVATKGEILQIETGLTYQQETYIGSVFLQHKEGNIWWAGSTYKNNDATTHQTKEMRANLEARIKRFLKVDYKVREHLVGVRPAVKDRRPLVGEHPTLKGVYILNGLGSKGSSLAPLMAKDLLNFIFKGTAIHPEAAIERFE
jgi:glycine oxidase